MIDHARPADQNMCDIYHLQSTPAIPPRLDDFQVFRKGPYLFNGNYNYAIPSTFDVYNDTDYDTANNDYHTLVSPQENYRVEWQTKCIMDWTEDDTMQWIVDTARRMGYSEYDVPFHKFKITGNELKKMTREEIVRNMMHPSVDSSVSSKIADVVFEKIQHMSLFSEEMQRASVVKYADSDPYANLESSQTMLDLDSLDYKNRYDYNTVEYTSSEMRLTYRPGQCESADDAEEALRLSESASPFGSDASKSGDEEEKRKKRPPGRPKGSGRKISPNKRQRSVSVPEFLRNLLLNPEYCPSIIKWEDYKQRKFRFVKPDEVAKLWGRLKQNDNMTFEKFSRAMRYHYRQSVLVSVPTARLVYQFGHKGPDIRTDNPNFSSIKPETLDIHEMAYS